MKTGKELAAELETISIQYEEKVDEIRETYTTLKDANQMLIISDFGPVTGRPFLLGDMEYSNSTPSHLKIISLINALLENEPKFYI